jgi:hexosaminidase
MSWQGEKGGITAANASHNVIMNPVAYCYFDNSQTKNEDSLTRGGFIPVEKVYSYEPIPAALDSSKAKYILGAQGNVWTEYFNKPSKVEYMIFPRMSALSEVLWSPKENRDWKTFESRIPAIFHRYKLWKAMYSTAFYDLQSNVTPTEDNNGVYWALKTNKKDEKIYHTLQSQPKRVIVALSEMKIKIWNTKEDSVYTIMSNGQAKYLKQKFYFTKATGKKVTLKDSASPNYPGSGAFTLVNGIITERQLSQSSEWLGFLGKNMEAVIDLGKVDSIHRIGVDVLRQEGSWIYLPAAVEYYTSNDNITFTLQGSLKPDINGNWPNERQIRIDLSNVTGRYIKVIAKNFGIIPTGKPGASNPAWLFVDEIEVE